MLTHSNREEWLNAAVEELRPIFDSINYPLPFPDRLPALRASPGNQ